MDNGTDNATQRGFPPPTIAHDQAIDAILQKLRTGAGLSSAEGWVLALELESYAGRMTAVQATVARSLFDGPGHAPRYMHLIADLVGVETLQGGPDDA